MTGSLIARLRAAHALAFAMSAGQRPDPAALEDIGMGGIDEMVVAAGCGRSRPAPGAPDQTDGVPREGRLP